jgi:Zn-dependent protease
VVLCPPSLCSGDWQAALFRFRLTPKNFKEFTHPRPAGWLPSNLEMIYELFTNPISLFISILAFLVALAVHEFFHAWSSEKLGDPTAKYEGRLSLNPLAHLDPIGTLMILMFGFGWGKPVPVNPLNFDNPRRDTALVSLSGPASNLVIATFLGIILKLPLGSPGLYLELLLAPIAILNVTFGIFNLLPISPLDGFSIVRGFLPREAALKWEELEQYGLYILVFCLLPIFNGESLISLILSPIINIFLKVTLGY